MALAIGTGVLAVVVLACGYRMIVGPDDANRAAAADLLFFCVVGLLAMIGVHYRRDSVFDVVLIASVVGFIASVSLARAMTRGRR